MRSDFVAFILTHGRAKNCITYKKLRKCGYTGRIVLVVDDEDEQIGIYRHHFQDVEVFSKSVVALSIDEADNFNDRRTIVYARNACFEIAKKIGVKYFIELDDDYSEFSYSYDKNGNFKQRGIKSLDLIFESMIKFYERTPIKTIAMAQRGDFIGGKQNSIVRKEQLRRKAMNTFICSTERPFQFVGRINEDVNTYTTLGSRGGLFFQVPQVAINQEQTQKNNGGMTDIYFSSGTYVKSFYTVMMMPSSVKIGLIGNHAETMRLHHKINWNNTVPKILNESLRKSRNKSYEQSTMSKA
ncbi:MAG: hypothetical protein ACRCZB_07605 [Bacteroidales bacterium]